MLSRHCAVGYYRWFSTIPREQHRLCTTMETSLALESRLARRGTLSSSQIPQHEAHTPVRFPRLHSTIEGAGYRSTRGQLRSCSETTVAAKGH